MRRGPRPSLPRRQRRPRPQRQAPGVSSERRSSSASQRLLNTPLPALPPSPCVLLGCTAAQLSRVKVRLGGRARLAVCRGQQLALSSEMISDPRAQRRLLGGLRGPVIERVDPGCTQVALVIDRERLAQLLPPQLSVRAHVIG